MSLEPNTPIIYPLCNASLSLYRSSADINEALYKQAFALLFAKGFDSDSDVYVGTQKMISCASPDSDLKYVEISGTGLSEQRIALENKYNRARDIGLSILNSGSTGESVKTSINMKVASLKSISKTLADGFTSICKFAAYWRGLKEEDINNAYYGNCNRTWILYSTTHITMSASICLTRPWFRTKALNWWICCNPDAKRASSVISA